ncbi:MAG: hypothetical protein MK135_03540 [Polyangiaceae bacterium]|nr:hypothetical protein [Polyangiaceae bacterium]
MPSEHLQVGDAVIVCFATGRQPANVLAFRPGMVRVGGAGPANWVKESLVLWPNGERIPPVVKRSSVDSFTSHPPASSSPPTLKNRGAGLPPLAPPQRGERSGAPGLISLPPAPGPVAPPVLPGPPAPPRRAAAAQAEPRLAGSDSLSPDSTPQTENSPGSSSNSGAEDSSQRARNKTLSQRLLQGLSEQRHLLIGASILAFVAVFLFVAFGSSSQEETASTTAAEQEAEERAAKEHAAQKAQRRQAARLRKTVQMEVSHVGLQGVGNVDALRHAFESDAPELTRCFSGRMKEEAPLLSRVELSFFYDTQGGPRYLRTKRTTQLDPRVLVCLLESVQKIQLPSSEEGVQAKVTLLFRQEGAPPGATDLVPPDRATPRDDEAAPRPAEP